MGGLAGRGEVPQFATTPEVLEAGHPVGVLGPGDRPPLLELAQLLGQMGDVMSRRGELGGDLVRPHLDLVPLLGRHQQRQDGEVVRGGRLDGRPEDLQLVELTGLELPVVERGADGLPGRRGTGRWRSAGSTRGPDTVRGTVGSATVRVSWFDRPWHG